MNKLTGDENAYLEMQIGIKRLGLAGFASASREGWPRSSPGALRVFYVELARMFGVGSDGFWRLSFFGAMMAVVFAAAMVWDSVGWQAAAGAAVVVSGSPLANHLSRRCLPDALVAGLQLGVVMTAWLWVDTGSPFAAVGLGFLLFMLAATRESSWFGGVAAALSAAAWAGAGWVQLATLAAGACACLFLNVLVLRLRGVPFSRLAELVRVQALQGETSYSKAFQSGADHRLLVDLVLLSPLVVVCFLMSSWGELKPLAMAAVASLVVHSAMPLKNVRTILMVDLAMRAVVGAVLVIELMVGNWLALVAVPGLLCADVWISYRVFYRRKVYDPVTSNLTEALDMSPALSLQKTATEWKVYFESLRD